MINLQSKDSNLLFFNRQIRRINRFVRVKEVSEEAFNLAKAIFETFTEQSFSFSDIPFYNSQIAGFRSFELLNSNNFLENLKTKVFYNLENLFFVCLFISEKILADDENLTFEDLFYLRIENVIQMEIRICLFLNFDFYRILEEMEAFSFEELKEVVSDKAIQAYDFMKLYI